MTLACNLWLSEAKPKQDLFVPLSLAECHPHLWHQGREEPRSLSPVARAVLALWLCPQGSPSSLAPRLWPLLACCTTGGGRSSNYAFPFPFLQKRSFDFFKPEYSRAQGTLSQPPACAFHPCPSDLFHGPSLLVLQLAPVGSPCIFS